MNSSSRRLTAPFFLRPDVVKISRQLLGKCLFTRINRATVTGGIVVETEAYAGPHDRASHAYNNRFSRRTEVMYRRGPVAYVYLCYGLHWLFNVITNVEGIPHAVLIRAIQPVKGIKLMLKRRGKKEVDSRLTAGPAVLSQALGICGRHSGLSLLGHEIWLEDGIDVPPAMIGSSARVGVDYAGKDARLPWRFYIRDNAWVSRPPPKK